MSLDLSPAGAAAPRGRRILSHARTEASLLLRNGEQLILALVIPAGLLVVGLLWGGRLGLDPHTFPASVLALALLSTGFTSLAIATGFERRYGVLERLVATPLTRNDLVWGKALASASIAVGQVVVLSLIAVALGWRPTPTWAVLPQLIVSVTLGVITFAALGLLVAGRLQAEVTLGLANLLYVALAALGAVVVPLASYPTWAQPVIALLPTAALGEGLRGWASGTTVWWVTPVLLIWMLLSVAVARKAFRWTS